MKKTLIWTIIGGLVIALGATLILTGQFPISIRSDKEAAPENDLSVAKAMEGKDTLSYDQPEKTSISERAPVAGVLWCRDEFGRLYNIVQTEFVDESENPNPESKLVSYWFRDESGRFHKEEVEIELNQTTDTGVIWYRDETGRLFKAE